MHILGRKNSQVYAFFQCLKRSREQICIYLVRKLVRYMHFLENGYKSERKYA